MKSVFLLPFILGLCACSHFGGPKRPMVTYEGEIFTPVTFIEHPEPGAYLAYNVHYPPVEKVRQELEDKTKTKLQNRGEAHITIVSSSEYEKVLKKYLPIEKINEMARTARVQQFSFEILCVGQGRAVVEDGPAETYFLVVRAPRLSAFREEIREAYVQAGGPREKFSPEDYQPHITLGFTKRDLHKEDGVLKDESSCAYESVLAEP